jgi:hypothetical protein
MPNVTIAVTDELKKEMEKMPEVNWSGVARKAIAQRIELLKKLDKLTASSTLTEEDTILLGRKVKAGMAKKFLEMK